MAIDRKRMAEQLILHEGLRLVPYVDTEMNWTIGVGYNITGRGWDFFEKIAGRKIAPKDGMTEKARVTQPESLAVLDADIDRVEKAVSTMLPGYDGLNEVRQRVCVDISFNIAYKALGFRKAIAAIEARDWSKAAKELYNSKWARQVGDGEGGQWDRADRLAKMLLTGQDYTR